jgi:hypothetical protein
MGFSVPRRLLGRRWSLTPPFHPCLDALALRQVTAAVCFLWHYPSGRLAASPPACIPKNARSQPGSSYAASCPLVFGLSSPAPRRRGRSDSPPFPNRSQATRGESDRQARRCVLSATGRASPSSRPPIPIKRGAQPIAPSPSAAPKGSPKPRRERPPAVEPRASRPGRGGQRMGPQLLGPPVGQTKIGAMQGSRPTAKAHGRAVAGTARQGRPGRGLAPPANRRTPYAPRGAGLADPTSVRFGGCFFARDGGIIRLWKG